MPKQEPVLRFAGAAMAFRLEAMFGDNFTFSPEILVGRRVVLKDQGSFGELTGVVRSVEPYVDPQLGPGHWVTLGAKGMDE